MAYTVKKVAEMSGISVRTLHFYDEAGLLRPAYIGANGYRFYEEAQLLTLQQILFYRELGFELKHIKDVLNRPDFDKVAALESHRIVLRRNQAHTRKLIQTIDKTIERLKGTKKVKDQELFVGFDPQEQASHERYLIDRYGAGMKASIAKSRQRVKDWTKADWEQSGGDFNRICQDLVSCIQRELSTESREAQAVIRRHYEWLKRFWTPNRESYAGHALLIADSELRKAYEKHDPRLPEFTTAAIKVFAENELC